MCAGRILFHQTHWLHYVLAFLKCFYIFFIADSIFHLDVHYVWYSMLVLIIIIITELLFLNHTSKKSAENRKLLCMIQYFMKSVFISILTLQIECHVNAMSQQKQQQRNKHLNHAPTSVLSSALVFLEATHQPWG